MKLFAIVDSKGVQVASPKMTDDLAWAQFLSMKAEHHHFRVMVEKYKESGYRCIELHTYDPSKQVVVDKQVFDFLHGSGELEGCSFGERHPEHKGAFWWRKFLKTGEVQP